MRARPLATLAILVVVTVPAVAQITKAPVQKSKQVARAETFAKGLVHPWALAFLPDGRLLVTERPGRMRLIAKDGRLSPPLANVPAVVARGQGGLLDVALAPDFATSRLVYLSYAEPREGGSNGASVARARLTFEGEGGRL